MASAMTEHEMTQLVSRLYGLLRELQAERLQLEEERPLRLDASAEHVVALAMIKTVEEGLLHALDDVLAALTQLRTPSAGATAFRRELDLPSCREALGDRVPRDPAFVVAAPWGRTLAPSLADPEGSTRRQPPAG